MPRLLAGETVRPLRRRAVTRELLLDAAERLIVDGGYSSASVEGVCSEAGYTRGAFYSNFATREELLLGLFERHAERRMEALSTTPPECLFAAADEERTWALLFLELRLQATRSPVLAAKLAEHDQTLVEALAESVPVEMARALLAAREGLLVRAFALGHEVGAELDAAIWALSALLPLRRPARLARNPVGTIPLW